MDILEQIKFVNQELKKGLSITKIEKNLKLGKDTLRKRLNKQGYMYNKMKNEFIKTNNQNSNKQTNKYNSKQTNNDKQINSNNKEIHLNYSLTEDEFKILKELIAEKIANKDRFVDLLSNDYKTTTLEIEVNLVKKLEEYCYNNKLTKKTVINQALIGYLNK